MPRPPKETRRSTFRLHDLDRARLAALAAHHGIDRTEVLRRAIRRMAAADLDAGPRDGPASSRIE